jgi:putative transposase
VENLEGDLAMAWNTLLASVTGSVAEQRLRRIESLVADNGLVRTQSTGRLQLRDTERTTLAELGKKLGKQALEEVAKVATPDPILGWHRTLVAQKFAGSTPRKTQGRPRVDKEARVVQRAREQRSWGDERIAGALAHLGYEISEQTVGDSLKRRGLPPAPERKPPTWKAFIRSHRDVLGATAFFPTAVWTWGGLVTYSVLLFRHVETRQGPSVGAPPQPEHLWMQQSARTVTMDEWGLLEAGQYVILARDGTEKVLDPVARWFTPAVAKQIAELRAEAPMQARIDELAFQCHEGA